MKVSLIFFSSSFIVLGLKIGNYALLYQTIEKNGAKELKHFPRNIILDEGKD